MTIIKSADMPFLDEKYGIIKNVYNLPSYTGLPRVYVKMAFGGNYATSGFNASGAGVTSTQALNSAVGEYLERYSCLHPNVTFDAEDNNKKIHPSVINNKADNNFKNYQWVPGTDCINKVQINLPADAIYLTYKSDQIQNKWTTTSTGAACGQNMDQCCWKGISEILERDAFQYTWRRQLACDKVNLYSHNDLKNYYEDYISSPGIEFRLYKLEMDWDAPAVFGIAEFENGGCVVAASVRATWLEACKKTLLELAQSVVGYAAIIFGENVEKISDFSNIKEYQDHSLLYFSEDMARHLDFLDDNNKEFDVPLEENFTSDTFLKDFFIEKVKRINKEIYLVNVTSPELIPFGWLVGKVIVPHMLDIEPNFIPILRSERLKEVDRNLLKMKKRQKEELIKGQPKVPHPFP